MNNRIFRRITEKGGAMAPPLFALEGENPMSEHPTTIVAVATPAGTGGLAVVRLSGPEAFGIAGRVFAGAGLPDKVESHRAVHGTLCWPKEGPANTVWPPGSPVDEVLALPLAAPRSYTGEDSVEFYCHGGQIVADTAAGACRAAGAEPATAGEFTRRAFLNGKISLDQAEAVADLIHAESGLAARAALKQLRGGLDNQLQAIEKPLLGLLASLEGSLEFVEEEGIEVALGTLTREIESAIERIDRLVAMAPAGRLLREGIQVVLAGPPNVGKSSLFNALAGQEHALVDHDPGTTRDVVTARVTRDGIVFVLRDTAGLRRNAGRVEEMGIARTLEEIDKADIVLALHEAGGDDASSTVLASDGVVLRVATKVDQIKGPGTAPLAGKNIVLTSSKERTGLRELWEAMQALAVRFRLHEAASVGAFLNERHRHKLSLCREELNSLLAELSVGQTTPPAEVVGTQLGLILAHLGEISGRVFSERVLEEVFQRFCVGK